MKKINKKLTFIILSGFILVTGCNKTEEKPLITRTTTVSTVQSTENIIVKNNTEKTDDEEILEYIVDLKTDINNIINSKEVKNAKETVIKKFITLTDFIFYDTEINGIKYDDLKEETKESILDTYSKIDETIENKFPNYKENLKDKYNLTKSKIKDKYTEISNDLKEKVKEEIGDDTYNDIIETNKEIIEQDKENLNNVKEKVVEKIGEENINNIKETNKEIIEQDKKNLENVKEAVGETADKAKTKVKNWYQDLKNKY